MVRLYCYGKHCKFIIFNSFHKALLSLKIKAHLSLENINREKLWALFHHTEMTFQQKPGISSENHLSNKLVSCTLLLLKIEMSGRNF